MIKRFNKKGFTLVEIIVVLVILAILAAIAVPSVLGYVEEAKKWVEEGAPAAPADAKATDSTKVADATPVKK